VADEEIKQEGGAAEEQESSAAEEQETGAAEDQESSNAEGQESSAAEGQAGLDVQDRQDGLEGQEGQDRREANEGVQEGESLAKRGAAEVKAILEALIFASPDPLTPKAMFKLLDTEPKEDVQAALAELKQDYEQRPGGLQLVEVAGGYQIVTRSDLHEWVRRLFHERTTQKLTVQGLETLAVIAYREPITAAEITEVRGVNTSGVLNTLLERHLIKIVGRKQVVGRPFMYATTKEFLIRFGLNDLADLPKVEDMAEALGLEAPILIERTPAEEMLPLEEPEGEDETPSDEPGSVH
jgi:segregation and condensation protein B